MGNTRLGSVLIAVSIAAIAACGGDAATPDAPPAADAVPQAVMMVTCTGTPPVVTTPALNFSPGTTTINAGGLVRFTLGATHNVVSTTPGQVFSLPLGANACLRFDAAGTYTFRCSIHGFTGMVVVQ